MKKTFDAVKVVGYFLGIFYGVLLAGEIYVQVVGGLDLSTVMVTVLLASSLIGSLGVMRLKTWGRTLLIGSSWAMAIYFLGPYLTFENFEPFSLVGLNVLIIIYFTQSKIKFHFPLTGKRTWKSILIIDDDETVIKTIRPSLIANGYSVLSASSGESGMQIAHQQKPHLILLDVILPGVKGRDVCKQLKEDPETKNIHVVFLTSKDSSDDIQAEMAAGGAAHLTKPVNTKALITTVNSILK